ncbi:hypothetical protein F3N42_00420 [Marinihelvus fidelis]|uniref:Carbohydrate-binding domain-containing protein n=1 Tax=Marinihelvus fidelis TaxID=2613842 RepID=A0A5N0TL55_9GAMM|nr:carbohydrate-binding family 9-like protein [Marinihelvus fidelis]KAA9134049.1 hypothetical protein F3N42_00420 [Marinihelvus fidelis]
MSNPPTRLDTEPAPPSLTVPHRPDFSLTGAGDAPAWADIDWVPLNRRPGGAHDYSARFKLCWSDTGIYVLFDGSDRVLTATLGEDFLDLWEEDVYEVFFWPDESHPVYFEYEISPLGYELPILVPNLGGRFLGWRPWHYEGERKTRRKVAVRGGEQAAMAEVTGWSAEVFIPFDLLKPLANVPPGPGTTWRANVYRMDYDDGKKTQWDWARVGPSFHEFQRFGALVFA